MGSRAKESNMNKTIYGRSLSFMIALMMMISMFGICEYVNKNQVFAETDQIITADKDLNNIKIPQNIKRGYFAYITVSGDRYDTVKNKYTSFVRSTADLDIFSNGEEFFQPSSINVKSIKKAGSKYNKTDTYELNNKLTRSSYGVKSRLSAGKYTITVNYAKRAVSLIDGISTVYFTEKDNMVDVKTKTFYVKSKVKFSYNKKIGKLAKSKRSKYLNPTQKYGKLPTPKAKKEYKFIGWYTKPNGGKKVKKSTLVPVKDDIILYARYQVK